jgi:hypothetical protein
MVLSFKIFIFVYRIFIILSNIMLLPYKHLKYFNFTLVSRIPIGKNRIILTFCTRYNMLLKVWFYQFKHKAGRADGFIVTCSTGNLVGRVAAISMVIKISHYNIHNIIIIRFRVGTYCVMYRQQTRETVFIIIKNCT